MRIVDDGPVGPLLGLLGISGSPETEPAAVGAARRPIPRADAPLETDLDANQAQQGAAPGFLKRTPASCLAAAQDPDCEQVYSGCAEQDRGDSLGQFSRGKAAHHAQMEELQQQRAGRPASDGVAGFIQVICGQPLGEGGADDAQQQQAVPQADGGQVVREAADEQAQANRDSGACRLDAGVGRRVSAK